MPALWPPTTAICGRSMAMCTPNWVKASCIRLMIGMSDSIPWLPDDMLWQGATTTQEKERELLYLEQLIKIYKLFSRYISLFLPERLLSNVIYI